MKKPENYIFVIFGGSGDLSKRKLIPALFNLSRDGLLPANYAIIGLGRKDYTDDSYRQKMIESITHHGRNTSNDQQTLEDFSRHLYYHQFDMSQSENYAGLKARLVQLDQKWKIGGNYLYYLATPPGFYKDIASNLGRQKLHDQSVRSGWKRIIIEKPFGYDLKSAQDLNTHLLTIFNEDQIYRIDHYLGKETVQNILAFRFANGIFEPLWNRNYIHHIEITAAENIGVEDRGGYYDQTGALRDMVQNHLLQILATVAMEPPPLFEMNYIRNEKMKVFQSLRPINAAIVDKQVIRGQYIESKVRGKNVAGYRSEQNVDPASQTETFVALKIYIDNWRWGGIPFYIRTGKSLPTRVTEVAIHFNKTPHHLFLDAAQDHSADNQLILRIQPDEGILLKFGMKVPGAGFNIKNVGMDFHYSDLSGDGIPEAYERLLLDSLLGDGTLYARVDSAEAAWEFIDPILGAWTKNKSIKIYGYPAGSWGPKEASGLFDEPEEDWRYPCKNLTNEDSYCEL
jgi:glucose-6-phosphate 1-dehydrogenase